MSRINKIFFDNGSGKKEIFAIKQFDRQRFDDFKDEIFIRWPELKNKSLKFSYEDVDGDKITIFNTNDFAIFQEQKMLRCKVFVEVQKENGSVNFAPINAQWPTLSGPPVFTSNRFQAAPGTSILKKLPSSASADDIRRFFHSGVICDNCDKEIRGYRYKCLECADYDLCMDCEPSNHSQHLLLRIANPNDAEICYRAKLGKRFGRHRRSESLCSKPTEDRQNDKKSHHDKKWHHKRHAQCSHSANFSDVISDILKSVAGTGVDVRSGLVLESNENPEATNQENQTDQIGKKPKTTSTATPLNTPSQGSFLSNNSANGKLKTHIDTLANMAQHFAAMMDPFAAYINESTANVANEQTSAAAPIDLNVLRESVHDILKALTPDNVDSVSIELLKYLNVDRKEIVSVIVSVILEKAINEPHLSAEIAKITKKLSTGSIFKKELLTKCQHEFQTHVADEHSINSELLPMQEELSSSTDENRKIELFEEEKRKLRRRSVGLVRFIGELYRQDMLFVSIVESCINTLLSIPTEEKLECLCELLTVAGQKMETRSGDAKSDARYYRDLTPHFRKIEKIALEIWQHSGEKAVAGRVLSRLLDLIVLQKNNWVQRSKPMDSGNTSEKMEMQAEPQISNQSDAMVIDCSDDEEEPVGALNRASRESSSDGSQSEELNRGDSPSHEWAFVNANAEIDDMAAQASASAQASTSAQSGSLAAEKHGTFPTDSQTDLTKLVDFIQKLFSPSDGSSAAKKTGTLPKQVSKQSQSAEPSLDYSELSRRLNDHIIGEKIAVEDNLAAARSATLRMITKAPESQIQPVESAPKVTATETLTDGGASRPSTDLRIVQAVNTMTAMGFSNEGGWLNQLLEAVNGDITSAIELMTPQK